MKDKDKSAAIHCIWNIVERALQETRIPKIVAAVQQILLFWKFIPPELRERAFIVFLKLWHKKVVVFSTRPEIPNTIFKNEFMDEQFRKIFESVTETDASIILLGIAMRKLINRGFHFDSDEIKHDASSRYGPRGLSITNLITTNDITFFLEEITELTNKDEIKKKFERWVNNYTKISILVSPGELEDPHEIEERILTAAKSLVKDYILINISAGDREIQKLIKIVEKLKEDKKLQFKKFVKFEPTESGFCTAFKGQIVFPE